MPALFFNSEVGPCDNEKLAVECLSRTILAYIEIEKYITDFMYEENSINNFRIYLEREKVLFLASMFYKLDKKLSLALGLILKRFSRGTILLKQDLDSSSLSLKEINLPSPLIECALRHKGMLFTIASDPYWEKDFIEFSEIEDKVPNIWGQTNFKLINKWIDNFYQNTNSFDGIKMMFDVVFCNSNISASTFTDYEWGCIYSIFKKAKENNFEVCSDFIEPWKGLPIFYIRHGNHSNFTIRIFFIKKDKKIYVGDIYHKNTDNTLKEESFAEHSYNIFKQNGLLT